MFSELQEINTKPSPFEFYTASELWTNPHTAKKMLEYHLNPSIDAASRNFNFLDKSSKWIIEHFHLNKNSKVIDFGCGPGLYTSRLAKCGAQVTGIDFSSNSIEYAKNEAHKKNLTITYLNENYLMFDTDEKFDCITMIMCDFAALSPLQRNSLLSKFRKLLKPTGAVLLDIYSPAYFDSITESAIYELNQLQNFWSPDDYYCFVNTFKYDLEKLILSKYTIFEKTRKRVVYNWFQCFSQNSIKSECEKAGLQISEFYSDVAGTAYNPGSFEFAIVAKIL